MASISVDQIYHLASPASPPNYMYNPVKTIKTNTIGTNNMLGKTVDTQVRASKYGRDNKGIIKRKCVFRTTVEQKIIN